MHPYLVATDGKFELSAIRPDDDRLSVGSKSDLKKAVKELGQEIDELQDKFFANGSKKLLLVLQGTDTSGKDGTVRKVFHYCDPLGFKTYAFKAPTKEELAHDYLWRAHKRVPGDGEIAIFNRSHYEDVLITNVEGWISEEQTQQRYRHIREFERLLVETGTVIIKCMLHVSSEMQRQRLQERVDNPDKHWKFSTGDLAKRPKWAEYQQAYENMLRATSTDYAPWHVVPADDKWYRNYVVGQLVRDTLVELDLDYPPADPNIADIVVE